VQASWPSYIKAEKLRIADVVGFAEDHHAQW